jgi:hypothetical protein
MKMMPYVNNEHISNVYKIYGPYLKEKGNPMVNKYKSNEKHGVNLNYLKNIEKYYDYNVYKPKKNNLDSSLDQGLIRPGAKVIPNRKLSPIGKGKQMIKI